MPKLRLFGGTNTLEAASVTISPLMLIVPRSARSNPAMQRSVVVLPQPLGPSSEMNWPGATVNDTSSTAVTAP